MTEKRKVRRVTKKTTDGEIVKDSPEVQQEQRPTTPAATAPEPKVTATPGKATDSAKDEQAKVGRPTGKIPTTLNVAFGRGGDWSAVTVDAPFHEKYGNPYGIAAMLMAMEVVETGGAMIPNAGGSGAYGIMQIKESSWGWLAKELGANLQTREGQIAVAAAILGKYGKGNTPRERFIESYYPVRDKQGKICLTCKGEDGGTPQQYLDDIDTLVKIINAAAIGTTPAPTRTATTEDAMRVILGGKKPLNSDFGFGEYNYDNGQPVNFYRYGPGHGPGLVADNQHPGSDISIPLGTTLHAPLAGVVRCVGNAGSEDYGQGCGAYADDITGGVGNLTIKTDDGLVYRFGHVNKVLVKLGQRVTPGQPVATSGGMVGPHLHLETSLDRPELVNKAIARYPGGYWMTPPLEEIAKRMDNVTDVRPMVVFAGASVAVPLAVPYRYVEIPKKQTNQRPGILMTPDRVIVHETDNINVNATAQMHAEYLANGAEGRQASWHGTIDRKEFIQHLPYNEVGWHGGDSGGPCNYKGLGFELCVDGNNKFKIEIRDNAEQVVAASMEAKTIDLMERHGTCCSRLANPSGCHVNCPKYINQDNYWPTFQANVNTWRDGTTPTDPVPTYSNPVAPPLFDGYDKVVNGKTFYALKRMYKTNKAGVIAYQYADKTSNPLRAPLAAGESFEGVYVAEGADGLPWIITTFGSRIQMSDVDPSFTVHDA